jgi:hypothetical protein
VYGITIARGAGKRRKVAIGQDWFRQDPVQRLQEWDLFRLLRPTKNLPGKILDTFTG